MFHLHQSLSRWLSSLCPHHSPDEETILSVEEEVSSELCSSSVHLASEADPHPRTLHALSAAVQEAYSRIMTDEHVRSAKDWGPTWNRLTQAVFLSLEELDAHTAGSHEPSYTELLEQAWDWYEDEFQRMSLSRQSWLRGHRAWPLLLAHSHMMEEISSRISTRQQDRIREAWELVGAPPRCILQDKTNPQVGVQVDSLPRPHQKDYVLAWFTPTNSCEHPFKQMELFTLEFLDTTLSSAENEVESSLMLRYVDSEKSWPVCAWQGVPLLFLDELARSGYQMVPTTLSRLYLLSELASELYQQCEQKQYCPNLWEGACLWQGSGQKAPSWRLGPGSRLIQEDSADGAAAQQWPKLQSLTTSLLLDPNHPIQEGGELPLLHQDWLCDMLNTQEALEALEALAGYLEVLTNVCEIPPALPTYAMGRVFLDCCQQPLPASASVGMFDTRKTDKVVLLGHTLHLLDKLSKDKLPQDKQSQDNQESVFTIRLNTRDGTTMEPCIFKQITLIHGAKDPCCLALQQICTLQTLDPHLFPHPLVLALSSQEKQLFVITEHAGVELCQWFEGLPAHQVAPHLVMVSLQLFHALETLAHHGGWAHNDLKAQNICVRAGKEMPCAYLIDCPTARPRATHYLAEEAPHHLHPGVHAGIPLLSKPWIHGTPGWVSHRVLVEGNRSARMHSDIEALILSFVSALWPQEARARLIAATLAWQNAGGKKTPMSTRWSALLESLHDNKEPSLYSFLFEESKVASEAPPDSPESFLQGWMLCMAGLLAPNPVERLSLSNALQELTRLYPEEAHRVEEQRQELCEAAQASPTR